MKGVEVEALAEARLKLRGRELPEMCVVGDEVHEFAHDWSARVGGVPGECRMRVYSERGGGNPYVAVITDLERGNEVATNHIEEIAARCTLHYSLPASTLWILHLLASNLAPNPFNEDDEQLILITFLPAPALHGIDVTANFEWLADPERCRLRRWLPTEEENR